MRKSTSRLIKRFVTDQGVPNRYQPFGKGSIRNPWNLAVKRLKAAYRKTPHNKRAAFKAQLA
jgi:hypothetical protein